MLQQSDVLVLITARGGSKGIPGKNIKPLNNYPLIGYSLDLARHLVEEQDICVSTDDDHIIAVLESLNYQVPFKRPSELATDSTGTFEVLRHAIEFYQSKGRAYKAIVLLQPTSPLRLLSQVKQAIALFNEESVDAVYAVHETEANPYYVLFNETQGYLERFIKTDFIQRQQAPKIWQVNGAIYVYSTAALASNNKLSDLRKVKKFVMPIEHAVDIDHLSDWVICEAYLEKEFVVLDFPINRSLGPKK